MFARRYRDYSMSIYQACEVYYSQVGFAMGFGSGVRGGVHLR